MDDHLKVEQLFLRYEKGETSLVPAIIEELEIHDKVESEVVYPQVAPLLRDWILEAEDEHEKVRDLIEQINDLEAGDPLEAKLMQRLHRRFKTHADREEKVMFPVLKRQLENESYEMGRQAFTVRQEQLTSMEGMADRSLPFPGGRWEAGTVDGRARRHRGGATA
jgi:hemerythrin-like domain-containing protein